MENKFLKYLQSNENLRQGDTNLDLSEHDITNSKNLLSLLKKSIKENDNYSCEHSLEELCLYVEGKSENNDIIKNQILECDNCFETYSFLKSQSEEIKNLTPPYFKDKVYSKNVVKYSVFNLIKNNKLIKYSSGAIAASLLLFITLNPFKTDMSDFHKSKTNSEINETSSVSNNKDIIENKKSSRVMTQDNEEPSNNQFSKPETPKQKQVSPQVELNKPPEITNEIEKKNTNKYNRNSNDTNPYKTVTKSDSRNKSDESLNKTEISNRSNPKKEVLPNILQNNPAHILKDESTKTSTDLRPHKDSNINPYIDNNKDTSKFEQLKEIESSKVKEQNNNSDLSDNIKSGAVPPPQAPKPVEPLTSSYEPKQRRLSKTDLSKNNAEDNKLVLSFKVEEKGFIVIKDLNNKVIYISNLLEKGRYDNFKIMLNVEEYHKYFYIDSNNNGFFDDTDIINNSFKILDQ